MSSTAVLPRTSWRRVHLFEWCDQPWLPHALRDAETDYLTAALALSKACVPLASQIGNLMDRADTDCMFVLASGGGGPWRWLAAVVRAARGGRVLEVILTDRYPNRRTAE